MRNIYLLLYYGFARYLPSSYAPVVGKPSNAIRIFLVKRIFKSCGKISTIDRLAYFGNGKDLEIGDYSGIGERCVVPKKYNYREICDDGLRCTYRPKQP